MNKLAKKNELYLNGERLLLRSITVDDVTPEYVAGLNDPEVNRHLVLAKPQTLDTVRHYVQANSDNGASLLLGIFLRNDQSPLVGTIRVSDINGDHYLANIGVCLFARRAWKRGFASEAMMLVVKYLFEDLGLHYLEAGVYLENLNSMALFKSCGFEEVYRVKNKYLHEGVFKEVVFWGIYNNNFMCRDKAGRI